MDPTNYYYHGLQEPTSLRSILEKGLLSRNNQKAIKKDVFSSKNDFLQPVGTNGRDYICVCAYKSLSYYMFSLPNISLIIKKSPDYKIIPGSLDGEYLIEDSIPKENIIGLAIRKLNLTKYNKTVYNYLSIIQENYKYITIPIYDIETGRVIDKTELNKMFSYLNTPPKINILMLGNIFSGTKDIIKEISNQKDYYLYETDKELLKDNKSIKEQFIKRYNFEINNYNQLIIYTDSLLDYKKYFSKTDWYKLLKELKINEDKLKQNYDLVLHLYSKLNNYKYIYENKVPKPIKDVYRIDEEIDKEWNRHPNYFKILPKENINDKLQEVSDIINHFI